MAGVSEKFTITPLKVLNFASFLQYQRFIMPISFLFYIQNGLNFSDFILFQSIFNITCLAAKIPMGLLGDIFSKKYILIFSYMLFMLRVILWICFSGFWIVLAGEMLYGLFKAFWFGNVDSYIFEWLKHSGADKKMLPSWGRLSFYTSLGSAISCFAGVILYKFFGFKPLLIAELVTQISALLMLFTLPDIKTKKKRKKGFYYIKLLVRNITYIAKNKRINYYVYYSGMLTGLTGVFVWNFQPLLKACSAPVFLWGVVNFVNQMLRGLGGLSAKKIVSKISQTALLKFEYASVLISFAVLILSVCLKNYIVAFICLMIICLAIFMFVIFNIFTIAKIHENTYDYKRATTSSTNTFFGDFASFALLLAFKFMYDLCGLIPSLLIFLLVSAVVLIPLSRAKEKIA